MSSKILFFLLEKISPDAKKFGEQREGVSKKEGSGLGCTSSGPMGDIFAGQRPLHAAIYGPGLRRGVRGVHRNTETRSGLAALRDGIVTADHGC